MNPTTPRTTTTSDRLTTVLSYGALLLLIYVVFRIVEPFLEPLAWSAVLAIFFYPLHEQLVKRMPPNMAALLSTLAVTILLIAPSLGVLVYTTREAIDATARVQAVLLDPEKALPRHALEWMRHELPRAWQSIDFSQPLRQGAERIESGLRTKTPVSASSWRSFSCTS